MTQGRKRDRIDKWVAGLTPRQKWETLARLVETHPAVVAKTLRKLARKSS